jgi:hypothetical protein
VTASSRSSNAARYGALAEQHVAEKFGFEGEHDYSHDLVTSDGEPVEVKASMRAESRADDVAYFRVFEEAHRRLTRADGFYAFFSYRPRGTGIEVLRDRLVRARAVRINNWTETGGHRDSRERRLRPQDVF